MKPGLYEGVTNKLIADWDKLITLGLNIEEDYIEYDEYDTENNDYEYISNSWTIFAHFYPSDEAAPLTLVIPNDIKTIGDYAFDRCDVLEKIIIPDGMEVIGRGAFNKCTALTEIYIPDSVSEIDTEAFFACKSLKSVRLSKKIDSILSYCFAYCSDLKYIEIPKNVKTIDKRAFIDCKNLKKIILTNKVNEDFMQKYEDKITYVNLDMLINSGTSFREANKILKNNEVNER